MSEISTRLAAAGAALESVLSGTSAISYQSDDQLLESTAAVEALSRQLDAVKVRYAGEVAVRSRAELGRAGLAARHGLLNAEGLLRKLTKTGYREAAKRVRLGLGLVHVDEVAATEGLVAVNALDVDSSAVDIPAARSSRPFRSVSEALAVGNFGAESADRVIGTLSPIVGQVDPEVLAQATSDLVHEAMARDADEVAAMARELRDTLDRVGVSDREARLREQRSLRRSSVVDGLRRVSLVLDPESDAILSSAIDAAMSPRLGGPRFVDPASCERGEMVAADARTNQQMALDVLVDLVRLGADCDDGRILGSVKPGVRVTISYDDLMHRLADSVDGDSAGVVRLEGSTEPVSAATARRILCEHGALPIVLGGAGIPLDVGRARRLFTAAQRVALAERDGGCRWPDCDRPPSWSEAHHIDPFGRGGATDLSNGILLCRRHHLLLHNNGWQILRDNGEYWLSPPKTNGSARSPVAEPVRMPGKTPSLTAGTAPINAAPINTAPMDTAPINTAPIDTAPIDTARINTVPIGRR